MTIPRIVLLHLLVMLSALTSPVFANPHLPYVPADLEPWTQWVMHDEQDQACTLLWNSSEQRRCQWPGSLSLMVNQQGGGFEQYWELEQEGWIQLPGDSHFWPQQVRVNDSAAEVLRHQPQLKPQQPLAHDEISKRNIPRPTTPRPTTPRPTNREVIPALWLEAGYYHISGRFSWSQLPETLVVPRETALLKLTRNGQFIHQPQLDKNGLLWLNRGDERAETDQDHISFRVFRHVADTIPLVLTTRIQLHVSGQPRELQTGVMLPQQFVPLALNSQLPARLENDGTLRMQLKPGNWNIELKARHQGPIDSLTVPVANGPWAAQEVWSVEAHPELRVISIEGATAVDPAQTGMPGMWRQFPAYIMTPQTTLQLVSRKRGDSDPSAERLQLQRTLWLDFDGGGYTIKDHLSGQLTSSARLEAGPQLQLGRVSSHGQDQFITRLTDDGSAGVELRQGQVDLSAESRLVPEQIGTLPAVGWQLNPDNLSARLNLPPGWRLIEATGVDSASSTWLQRWTLLDIFVVLVLALSFLRLWGFAAGVATLTAMALIYHEPNAPQLIWLHVLIPVALLRVLPTGRFKLLTEWYRNGALLVLLVIVLIFSVQQIRSALYPQLTPQHSRSYRYQSDVVSSSEVAKQAMEGVMMEMDGGRSGIRKTKVGSAPPRLIAHYDPNLKIQTGPGLPKWQWQQIELHWNGPVTADQQLKLYLLPPLFTRLLLVAGVVLMALMFLRLFSQGPLQRWKSETPTATGGKTGRATVLLPLIAAALLSTALTSLPQSAQAANPAFPSQELLNELHDRLTEPPGCAPNCSALDQLSIQADSQRLRLQMTYHSQVASAVVLPFPLKQLSIQSVRLDDKEQIPLYRDQHQRLWARVPAGQHKIELYATLPDNLQRLQLPLPMAAGMVRLKVPGWKVSGIADGQASHGPIELTRTSGLNEKKLQPGEIPAFVRVERELQLGLDWQVVTTLIRTSQQGTAAVLEIPLLSGERVTSRDITVKDKMAIINLPANAQRISWQSTLEKTSQLELIAAYSDQFSEIWRLNADRMWHIDSSGIPVIHRYQYGRWLPQWSPWPKEQLTLNISRPEGVQGQTITIDNSRLEISPGKRSTAVKLSLELRSSHGTDHNITLPDGAELGEVTINGKSQPIKQNKRLVTLPLVPGRQAIILHWLQPQGVQWLTRTPQVNLGTPHVENHVQLKLPASQWTLFTGGPVLGPAVLFWGVLTVIIFAAIILGRYAPTPLRWYHWLLLCAGLSQASLPALLPVVAWLILLGLRRKCADQLTTPLRFNLTQAALIFLSIMALLTIVGAIQQGLLGLPEMQIAGNNSSAWDLRWYQDRSTGLLAEAWAVSVPMYVYRGLMLLWALWLAVALLRWLNWGWESFSLGGIWQKLPPRQPRRKRGPATTGPVAKAANPAAADSPQPTPTTVSQTATAPDESATEPKE
ncbi:MAG: hypothetical protein J7K75_11990 [Desulfuromonas sp.]|nr:hypothetical protein [Desulfuromonas sp.]